MPNNSKTYKLERRCAVLGRADAKVTKEVTLGYWDGELRLDIRKWQDGELGKGISLTEGEVRELRDALDKILFGMR